MANEGFFLTPDDRKLIQDFLTRAKSLRVNIPPPSFEDSDDQSPETYVAQAPYQGIPALTGMSPGSAVCNIYQIINGTLQTLPTGLSKTVYNLSTSAVGASAFVPVTRDKFGRWIVLIGSGGGSGLVIRFHIEAAIPATNSCLCSIKSVPHGMTISQMPGQGLNSIVTVCDPVGCYFNEPSGQLLGRDGWAQYMDPQVPCPCQPGSLYPQWEVFALCCPGAPCG